MMSSFVEGHPCEASTRDHKVGNNNSSVPVWLGNLIRLVKAFSLMGWSGSEGSEGGEAVI